MRKLTVTDEPYKMTRMVEVETPGGMVATAVRNLRGKSWRVYEPVNGKETNVPDSKIGDVVEYLKEMLRKALRADLDALDPPAAVCDGDAAPTQPVDG